MGATASSTECCCTTSRTNGRGKLSPCDADEAPLAPVGKFQELMCGNSFGCVIERTEERGITMQQLQKVLDYVDSHCVAEQWTSVYPPDKRVLLNSTTINLYDVVHWIVRPATQRRQCSFVEFVASTVQIPKWFVSHWWGEPVQFFVSCLSQHSLDRALSPDSPYWVCAYANNQRQLASGASVDPSAPSFRKAIKLAQGTVTILDQRSITFSRIWCAYEMLISLIANGKSNYLYDIYTADGNQAVGLTDGFAAVDMMKSKHAFAENKYSREKSFPLHLAEAALMVKVQAGAASRLADKRLILNSIASRDNMEMEPLAEHANYEAVNRLLRGRLAANTWVLACESGRPMQPYSDALRNSGLQDFSASIDGKVFSKAVLRLFLDSLPLTVRTLELRFYGRYLGAASTLAWCDALPTLRHLTSLSLNLSLNSLGDTGVMGLGLALTSLSSLTDLSLHLNENNISDEGMTRFAELLKTISLLTRLRLHFCKNTIGDSGVARLAEAMTNFWQLTNLTLNLSENTYGPTGILALTHALKSQKLTKLELTFAHNKFGVEGALGLGEALKGLLMLRYLALDFNGLGFEEGGAVLGEVFESLSQLAGLRVHLVGNSFGNGATSLGRALTKFMQLSSLEIELDMKDGSDGPELLESFLMALSPHNKIARLTMRLHEPLGARHVVPLAEDMKRLSHLTHFCLELHMSGATFLGNVLAAFTQLTSLHLRIYEESLGDAIVVSICDALVGLSKLRIFELDLSVKSLTPEVPVILEDVLTSMPSLTQISVHLSDRSFGTMRLWNTWNQCLEVRKGCTNVNADDISFSPYWVI